MADDPALTPRTRQLPLIAAELLSDGGHEDLDQDDPNPWGLFDGCYEAARAAALSGVPLTAVYWWARHGVVVPSVSPERTKLWSSSDLIALRVENRRL